MPSLRHVDDTEATVSEADVAVLKQTLVVGPTVRELGTHTCKELLVTPVKPAYSTHYLKDQNNAAGARWQRDQCGCIRIPIYLN